MRKALTIISLINSLSKRYLPLLVIQSLTKALFPFINIYFSYLILDGLYAQMPQRTIFNYVLWLICLNLGIGIIIKVLDKEALLNRQIIEDNLQKTIAKKMFELDYEQVEDKFVKELLTKAQEGSNSHGGISSYCENILSPFISGLFTIIYSSILLFGLFVPQNISNPSQLVWIFNGPISAIFLLIIILAALFICVRINKTVNKMEYDFFINNVDSNRRFSYFFELMNYKLGKDIRIYHMQDLIMDYARGSKSQNNDAWRSFNRLEIKYAGLEMLIKQIIIVLSYLFVGIKALLGLVSIGNVLAYVGALTLLNSTLSQILSVYNYNFIMCSFLSNYFEFLNLKTKISYGGSEIQDIDNLEIEFKNVSFRYPNNPSEVLKNINFKIKKGDRIAIVGRNGAGKTTFVKLLCRLYEPDEGMILINGKDIKEYKKEECEKLFSVVFQDFSLFSFSIADNVACGNVYAKEDVVKCLKLAGALERINSMEKGIETVIYQSNKEKGVEISGGEAQKIAIARALYKNSPIVILDEPTSALDPISEYEIYSGFNKLIENKTAIYISHRMASCRFCDKIIVFDNGIIIQEGDHDTLLVEKDGLYNRLWTAQMQYYN